jgi:hypothetical protein
MKRLIVLAIAGSLFYSCSNSTPKNENNAPPPQTRIEITNDMENAFAVIPSWINEKTVMALKEPAAYSGEYACVTNDTIEYGYAYGELFKNINSLLPKVVNVSGWVYTTVSNPNLGIILDISQDGKLYDWKAFPLTDALTETGKWVEFNANFYFDKPLNPEQTLKIFPWNQSKKTVYFDDLKITFDF